MHDAGSPVRLQPEFALLRYSHFHTFVDLVFLLFRKNMSTPSSLLFRLETRSECRHRAAASTAAALRPNRAVPVAALSVEAGST